MCIDLSTSSHEHHGFYNQVGGIIDAFAHLSVHYAHKEAKN